MNKKQSTKQYTHKKVFYKNPPSTVELVKENQLIYTILESIDDAFISFDNEFHYSYLNSTAEKLLHKKKSELIGQSMTKAFPVAKGHPVEKEMLLAVKTKKTAKFEYQSRDNTWYEIKIFPSAEGVSVYFSNITNQKIAEENLKQNEIKFRALLENSSDGFRLINKDGKILYASPSTTKILGYSLKEYVNKNILSFIHPDDKNGYTKTLQKILHNPHKPISYTYRIKHKNDTWRWIEGVGMNLLNDPTIKGIISNFRDITDRKLADFQLKQNEALYRMVVENVNDLIALIDQEAKFLYASPSHQTLLGYNPKKLIGLPGLSLVHPDDLPMVKQALSKVLATGESKATFRIKKKNGDWLTIDAAGSLIEDIHGEKRVIMASHDVTERAELERRKDEFISMASHELKTPVTSQKLFIDVLQKQIQQYDDDRANKVVIRLKDQTERLRELISELLDLSRIQTGKLHFHKTTFDLSELIEDTVEGLQGTTNRHTLEYKNQVKIIVNADRFRLYQVLTNLITNAIKYSPKGNKIIVTLINDNEFATISVQDFGIGIPKSYQSNIFERLFQIPHAGEKTFPGLGMGLYISKDIVERHDGKIWLKSIPNKGTTFFFSLPIHK